MFNVAGSPPACAWRTTTTADTVCSDASWTCTHLSVAGEHHLESPVTLRSMTLSGVWVAVHAALPVGWVSGTGADPPSLLGAPLTARPRLPPAVPSGLVAPA